MSSILPAFKVALLMPAPNLLNPVVLPVTLKVPVMLAFEAPGSVVFPSERPPLLCSRIFSLAFAGPSV